MHGAIVKGTKGAAAAGEPKTRPLAAAAAGGSCC
jgi:hypothetical protein